VRQYLRLNRGVVWGLAVVTPLLAAVLMVPLRTHTQPSNLALVMVVVVTAAVLPGQRLVALAAGVSAGLWFDFFLTRPYERFRISWAADLQTTLLLNAVSAVVGEIATRRRRAAQAEEVARQEALSVYVVAQMLSAGASAPAVIESVAEQLGDLLFLQSCRFDTTSETRSEPWFNRAGELEYMRLGWLVEVDGLPNRDVTLPIESGGRRLGRFVLRGPTLGVPLGQDRVLTALALADLTGAALRSSEASIAGS
jgi:K+-sensing histidine kinase KdpD